MPYITQKRPDGSLVRQWQLGEQTMVFGRGADADVKIDDVEMSKRHFAIEPRNESFHVRDLNSANGTWVNKRVITEAELAPGDQIRAGQTIFVFEKGVGTVIGELAQEKKGYETVLKEISKKASARERHK